MGTLTISGRVYSTNSTNLHIHCNKQPMRAVKIHNLRVKETALLSLE